MRQNRQNRRFDPTCQFCRFCRSPRQCRPQSGGNLLGGLLQHPRHHVRVGDSETVTQTSPRESVRHLPTRHACPLCGPLAQLGEGRLCTDRPERVLRLKTHRMQHAAAGRLQPEPQPPDAKVRVVRWAPSSRHRPAWTRGRLCQGLRPPAPCLLRRRALLAPRQALPFDSAPVFATTFPN